MDNKQTISETFLLSLNTVCVSFTALLLILTISFTKRVPDWQSLSLEFLLVMMGYLVGVWFVGKIKNDFRKIALLTSIVLALFALLFGAVAGLQHILVEDWMDGALITFENFLIGTESSLYLQKFVHPLLTEAMMFSYVLYVPMLPLVSLICFWSGGARASVEYLLNLSFVNALCYAGFILFPVASPMYYQPELYTQPLVGGFFTWCGEWMRQNAHYAGGSLPSPHCAAGTVMLIMLYRYHRKLFYVALPIVLLLYISTVYGRYHYVWDGIAGIVSALFVVKFSPLVVTAIESVRVFFSRTTRAKSIPDLLTE